MRFLIDMNLSPLWVETLRASGYEATHWSTIGRLDAPDSEIMADTTEFIARQHERRKSGLTLEIYAEAARNPKVEAMLKRTSQDERDLITRVLKRMLPPETPAADIAARADLMRLIADGLLVHGLYAGDQPTGTLAEHVRHVIRLMFINRLPF